MAAAPSDALVRQGCMKIPRKFLDAGAKAGAAGTDGDAYGHVRGLGGMSYDARAGAAAKHRDVVLEEMLLAPGKETVTFGDVVGLEAAKRSLNEAVVLPLVAPQFFTGARRPWNGVLLFGPPGSGKTLLARAVAAVNGVSFFDAGAAALLDKFWGESEKLVRALFACAREVAPAIVFMDEIDALMGDRGRESGNGSDESSRRLKVEILAQMDGLETAAHRPEGAGAGGGAAPGRVIVIAASNMPWELDDAFRRRLEKRVYVPPPDAASREGLLRALLADVPVAAGVEYAGLAARAAGYSGADVLAAARDAAYAPVRRLLAARTPAEIAALRPAGGEIAVPEITVADLEAALDRTRPAAPRDALARYEAWDATFGSH